MVTALHIFCMKQQKISFVFHKQLQLKFQQHNLTNNEQMITSDSTGRLSVPSLTPYSHDNGSVCCKAIKCCNSNLGGSSNQCSSENQFNVAATGQ